MTTIKTVAVVRGNTIRAAIINLLLKNKGKSVPIASLKAAAQKATGLKPKVVDSRLKSRTALVNKWAQSRKMKLVVTKSNYQLQAGK